MTPDAPVALLHDAAFVASAFVNHVGSARPAGAPAEEVDSAAHILGRHLFAVLKESGGTEALGGTETLRRRLDAFGPGSVEVPMFDAEALDAVTDLAVDTEDALATLRAAQRLRTALRRHRVAGSAASAQRMPARPRTGVGHLARLEGYLLRHAGHPPREVQAAATRPSDAGSTVCSPGSALELDSSNSVSRAPGRSHQVKERWATHEARPSAVSRTTRTSGPRACATCGSGSLHASGVIAPHLPPDVLTGDGRLKPLAF